MLVIMAARGAGRIVIVVIVVIVRVRMLVPA